MQFLDVPAYCMTESWFSHIPENRKCKKGNRYFVWFFNNKMEGPMWHPVTLTANIKDAIVEKSQ